MKQGKRIASLALALLLVLALSVSAFAAKDDNHTITINNAPDGHTYGAYQVFSGDYYDGKLSNIAWGSGVNGEALLTALKNLDAYKGCTSAEDVANVLKGFEDDSAALDAFATIVGQHLATEAGRSTESKAPYTIKVDGDGYYFIKDVGTIGDNDAATKYILQVVEDSEIDAKTDVPEIDKVIVDADTENGKGTAQDVGSVVEFKLTSKVPDMASYTTYTYIVHDTMSDGLTFNANSVKITIGSTEYTDFTVSQNGQSFTITFNNFINQKANAGKDIVITYSATINEKALSTDVETNKVYLEYSNNPSDDSSKGKTPEKIVYVYDFDIVIDKYTGEEVDGTRLADAMFVLKNADGKYYHWDETNKTVTWVEVTQEPNTSDMTPAEIKAAWEALGVTVVTTDNTGAARFAGLDSGEYKLKEIAAPAGYNLLKEEVEVTITATYDTNGKLTSSSATSTNNGQYSQTTKVLNNSGTELPSTGGVGTTVFYVLGSVLVLGAAVLLITRRRMKRS